MTILFKKVVVNIAGATAQANETSGNCVVFDELQALSRLIDHEIVAKDQAVSVLDRLPSVLLSLHSSANLNQFFHEWVATRTVPQ